MTEDKTQSSQPESSTDSQDYGDYHDERLPTVYLTVQDLNLRSYQMLRNLVVDLQDKYAKKLQESFEGMRNNISGRELYVMFEPSLNCNPLVDHQIPKNVLPLFYPYIQQTENELLGLFDSSLPYLVFDYFLAILTAYILAQSRTQLQLDQAEEEISRFQTQTTVYADIIKTLQQTVLQEKQKHLRETYLLRDQLAAKSRYFQQYYPDFTDVQKYYEILQIPDISIDLEQFKQKTAKQIRLDSRPLVQEIKELRAVNYELITQLKQTEEARKRLLEQNAEDARAIDTVNAEIMQQKTAIMDLAQRLKVALADNQEAKEREAKLRAEVNNYQQDMKKMVLINRSLHEQLTSQGVDETAAKLQVFIEKSYRYEAEIAEQKSVALVYQNRLRFLEDELAKQRAKNLNPRLDEQETVIKELRQQNSKLFEDLRNARYQTQSSSNPHARAPKIQVVQQGQEDKEVQTDLSSFLACTAVQIYNFQDSIVKTATPEFRLQHTLPAQASNSLQKHKLASDSQIRHERNVSFGSSRQTRRADIRLVNYAQESADVYLAIDLNADGEQNCTENRNISGLAVYRTEGDNQETNNATRRRHFRAGNSPYPVETSILLKCSDETAKESGAADCTVTQPEFNASKYTVEAQHLNKYSSKEGRAAYHGDDSRANIPVKHYVTSFQANTTLQDNSTTEYQAKIATRHIYANETLIRPSSPTATDNPPNSALLSGVASQMQDQMRYTYEYQQKSCYLGHYQASPIAHAAKENIAVQLEKLKQDYPFLMQLAAELDGDEVLEVEIQPREILAETGQSLLENMRLQMEAVSYLCVSNYITTIYEGDDTDPSISAETFYHILERRTNSLHKISQMLSDGASVSPQAAGSAVFTINRLCGPSNLSLPEYHTKPLSEAVAQKIHSMNYAHEALENASSESRNELAQSIYHQMAVTEMKEQLIQYLLSDAPYLEAHSLDQCFNDQLLSTSQEKTEIYPYVLAALLDGVYSPFYIRKIATLFSELQPCEQALAYEIYNGEFLRALAANKLSKEYVESLLYFLAKYSFQNVLCTNPDKAAAFVRDHNAIFAESQPRSYDTPNIFRLSNELKECIEMYYRLQNRFSTQPKNQLMSRLAADLAGYQTPESLQNALKRLVGSSSEIFLNATVDPRYAVRVLHVYRELNAAYRGRLSQEKMCELVSELAQLQAEQLTGYNTSAQASRYLEQSLSQVYTAIAAQILLNENVASQMAQGQISSENRKLLSKLLFSPSNIQKLAEIVDKDAVNGLVNVLYNPELHGGMYNPETIKQIAAAFYQPQVTAKLFGVDQYRLIQSYACYDAVKAAKSSTHAVSECAPFYFCIAQATGTVHVAQTAYAHIPGVRVLNYQKLENTYRARKSVQYNINARPKQHGELAMHVRPLNIGYFQAYSSKQKNEQNTKHALRSKYRNIVPYHPTLDIAGLIRVEAEGQTVQQPHTLKTQQGAAILQRAVPRYGPRSKSLAGLSPNELQMIMKLLGDGYVPSQSTRQ